MKYVTKRQIAKIVISIGISVLSVLMDRYLAPGMGRVLDNLNQSVINGTF